ncbi:MAG: PrsW family intramembrane metalloprotease [Anaerolineaceae bacterium]|nr:PrsW family intramembrane metalloprotease [Anaerolineaceae bacterium]
MTTRRKILPSVLLLILSSLGILMGCLFAGLTLSGTNLFFSQNNSSVDPLPLISTAAMGITTAILNVPTLITTIKKLFGKRQKKPPQSLLRTANILLIIWFLILAFGFFVSRTEKWGKLIAPLTIAAVLIPIFWLVEFARRGLPRSTRLREQGTLTIGLTAAPLVIISLELVMIFLAVIAVIIALGFQGVLNEQPINFLKDLNISQGGIADFEKILFAMMRQPLIATAVFIALGLVAPLIEEIFKPLALWFLFNRPLHEHEGFSLGLISGGAFALIESIGLVIQIDTRDWLAAVVLRAATGVLHIGLSGLVGYGITKSINEKRFAKGIFYILAAALLHGAWNSLALFSGITSPAPISEVKMNNINLKNISVALLMIAVFITIIIIILYINRHLRKSFNKTNAPTNESIK